MNIQAMERSVEIVRERLGPINPACVIQLGSGWSEAVEALESAHAIDYSEIPCLGGSGIEGHAGEIRSAQVAGIQVLIFSGRRHWYEGCGWEPVAFPVFVSQGLGAQVMVLTNAAGGLRPDLRPGDLMVIDDHINAMGVNPLVGVSGAWGPRFAGQSAIYDRRMRTLLDAAADRVSVRVRHGVYLATSGPSYETPAEAAMFRSFGADAVGMSTVPEAMLANAAGLKIAAISCIANAAGGSAETALTHEDVCRVARGCVGRMRTLLLEFLKMLAADF